MVKRILFSYSVFPNPPNCNARKKGAMIGLKKRVFVQAIVRFGLDNSDFLLLLRMTAWFDCAKQRTFSHSCKIARLHLSFS